MNSYKESLFIKNIKKGLKYYLYHPWHKAVGSVLFMALSVGSIFALLYAPANLLSSTYCIEEEYTIYYLLGGFGWTYLLITGVLGIERRILTLNKSQKLLKVDNKSFIEQNLKISMPLNQLIETEVNTRELPIFPIYYTEKYTEYQISLLTQQGRINWTRWQIDPQKQTQLVSKINDFLNDPTANSLEIQEEGIGEQIKRFCAAPLVLAILLFGVGIALIFNCN